MNGNEISSHPNIGVKALSDFPSCESLEECVEYPALSIPVHETAKLRRKLADVLLHRPKMKIIYNDREDSGGRRILLLKPSSTGVDTTSCRILEDPIFQHPAIVTLVEQNPAEYQPTTYPVRLGYDAWSVEEVLQKILPQSIDEIPTSFETVGSIAHINLRDELLPYKYWIGKVILDKHQPRLKTVVNKLGTIENEYRTFGMEVIAGNQDDGWSLVSVKEEGCVFDLDFQHVYWNSRLGGEHRRLVDLIRNDAKYSKRGITVVADLMAGVGPFAVPLTKTRQASGIIRVYANDLNPISYKYLCINESKNKCKDLKCYNMDARAFVNVLATETSQVHHVIMNLPASATEFLDAFRGWPVETLPILHVYCFAPKVGGEEEAIERCSQSLGCTLSKGTVSIRVVRDVAPNKNMLCISFQLPKAVRGLSLSTSKQGAASMDRDNATDYGSDAREPSPAPQITGTKYAAESPDAKRARKE